MAVKKRFGKDNGVMAYHGYQSFAPGEATPEAAHEIGVRLAEWLWGDRYQVLVATHLDKESHLHNHFVVNSVSSWTACGITAVKKITYAMRRESDRLCLEYGLSVLPPDAERGRSRQYGEWRAEKEERPTFRGSYGRMWMRPSIWPGQSSSSFSIYGRKDTTSSLAVTSPCARRERSGGWKLARNFGPEYTREAICRRILEHPGRKQRGLVLSSRQGARHARFWETGRKRNTPAAFAGCTCITVTA